MVVVYVCDVLFEKLNRITSTDCSPTFPCGGSSHYRDAGRGDTSIGEIADYSHTAAARQVRECALESQRYATAARNRIKEMKEAAAPNAVFIDDVQHAFRAPQPVPPRRRPLRFDTRVRNREAHAHEHNSHDPPLQTGPTRILRRVSRTRVST